jgi:DNA-binding NarL/FixJ family response regulator
MCCIELSPFSNVSKPEVALPCRILIADDHSQLRNALKAVLESHAGWQVCAEAANGLQAVREAAESKPDLIILDLSMPVMDGLQAASQIRSVTPGLPIVLFTNHLYPTLAAEAQKAGIRRVVSKESGDLVSAIEAILDEMLQSAVNMIQPDIQSNQEAPSSTLEQQIDETGQK